MSIMFFTPFAHRCQVHTMLGYKAINMVDEINTVLVLKELKDLWALET